MISLQSRPCRIDTRHGEHPSFVIFSSFLAITVIGGYPRYVYVLSLIQNGEVRKYWYSTNTSSSNVGKSGTFYLSVPRDVLTQLVVVWTTGKWVIRDVSNRTAVSAAAVSYLSRRPVGAKALKRVACIV